MNHTTATIVSIIAILSLFVAVATSSAVPAIGYKHHNRHSHNYLHHYMQNALKQSTQAAIEQNNDQSAVCISGATASLSCNNVATNLNTGNSVGANVGSGSSGSGSGSQRSSSGIHQVNHQRAVCISGSTIGGSCNNIAANANTGNAVGADVGGSSGGGNGNHQSGSQRAHSAIEQRNNQDSVCIEGVAITGSCNNVAANANTGNTVGAGVR
jgi:hypothetical protein